MLVKLLSVKMVRLEVMWEKGNSETEEFRKIGGLGCAVEEHLEVSRCGREVDGPTK